MRDRNNFDYTRSAEGDGFADLKRVAPTEEIRPVHYGESDVGAMRFSSAQSPAQQSFDGGRAPEQQSFIPNNFGAPSQNAYASAPTDFGGNGFGDNGQNSYNSGNGFVNNGQNNYGGNGFSNQPPQGYNAQPHGFVDQPLQTSERPLVFKNKRVPGQYIYEYRDRLELYRYTGLGMIYEKTFLKNGY